MFGEVSENMERLQLHEWLVAQARRKEADGAVSTLQFESGRQIQIQRLLSETIDSVLGQGRTRKKPLAWRFNQHVPKERLQRDAKGKVTSTFLDPAFTQVGMPKEVGPEIAAQFKSEPREEFSYDPMKQSDHPQLQDALYLPEIPSEEARNSPLARHKNPSAVTMTGKPFGQSAVHVRIVPRKDVVRSSGLQVNFKSSQ